MIRILNDRDGSILGTTKDAPNLGRTIPFVDRTEFIQGYRVGLAPYRTAASDPRVSVPVVIQYARKVSDLENTVDRVRFFLIFGVLGGTLLARSPAASWLAGRAMRPIAALTADGARDRRDRAIPTCAFPCRRPTTRSPSSRARSTTCSTRWLRRGRRPRPRSRASASSSPTRRTSCGRR